MGHAVAFTYNNGFVIEECWVCGVTFAITGMFKRKRVEKGDVFFCPKGDRLSYGASEIERLKREVEERDRQLAFERERASKNFKEREKAEKQVRRLKKRAANGVCPCCQRSFTNVRRHVETQHPDWKAEANA